MQYDSALLLLFHSVSYALPDGRVVFDRLDLELPCGISAVIGRNGVGKSLLAALASGEVSPTAGEVIRRGTVYHVPQRLRPDAAKTVGDLVGLGPKLAALARIENGSSDPADFEQLADHWTIREQMHIAFQACGLEALRCDTISSQLSGGELTRAALATAEFLNPDILILDEPGNHLDSAARDRLVRALGRRHGITLIISHDRDLLEVAEQILELTASGVRRYSGNYRDFEQHKLSMAAAADRELSEARAALKRQRRDMRHAELRQARRTAAGRRGRSDANQSKLLLDAAAERSDRSGARLARQFAQQHDVAQQRLKMAAQRVDDADPVALISEDSTVPAGREVARFEGLSLRRGRADIKDFNAILCGPSRVALTGPNGSGKSSLLRLLTGELVPDAGTARVLVPWALLDQKLANLADDCSALDHLHAAAPTLSESVLRTRLAQLRVKAERALLATGSLSEGERLKVALACALHRKPAPQLLLLDEPTNHLDLESIAALEATLCAWRGALIVASHDRRFLANIAIDKSFSLE